jgi:uridine kinase
VPNAAEIAALIPTVPGRATLVAIDGVDGSGKTTFADALGATLRAHAQFVQIVHLDDFHHLRAVRYRRGRLSPEGFFLDSYDYEAFFARVVEPLRDGRNRIRLYFEACDPKSRADLVIDNS